MKDYRQESEMNNNEQKMKGDNSMTLSVTI